MVTTPLSVGLYETPRHLRPGQVCTALIACSKSEHPADKQGNDRGRIIPIWINWNAGYNIATLPSSQPALSKLLIHRPASMSFGQYVLFLSFFYSYGN